MLNCACIIPHVPTTLKVRFWAEVPKPEDEGPMRRPRHALGVYMPKKLPVTFARRRNSFVMPAAAQTRSWGLARLAGTSRRRCLQRFEFCAASLAEIAQQIDRSVVQHVAQLGECLVRREISIHDRSDDLIGTVHDVGEDMIRILLILA